LRLRLKERCIKGVSYFNKRNGIKNGRKKTVSGKVKDALKLAEDAMPELYMDMVRDAKDPKVPVAVRQSIREYLSDRIYGRPTQPLGGTGEPIRILLEEYRAILKDTG